LILKFAEISKFYCKPVLIVACSSSYRREKTFFQAAVHRIDFKHGWYSSQRKFLNFFVFFMASKEFYETCGMTFMIGGHTMD
jgi:hypothetical protein